MSGKRLGRRPGSPATSDVILAAAREAFAAHGFSGTTIRTIASEASVDPALVHHYFGNKRKLFLAALDFQVDLSEVVETVMAGPVETVGVRIARTLLTLWDSPAGAPMVAVLRSAIGDAAMAATFREFLLSEVIGRILTALDCPADESGLRGSLLTSQILGVIVGRHILTLEPLASQSTESLVPPLGATLQHYATGPVS